MINVNNIKVISDYTPLGTFVFKKDVLNNIDFSIKNDKNNTITVHYKFESNEDLLHFCFVMSYLTNKYKDKIVQLYLYNIPYEVDDNFKYLSKLLNLFIRKEDKIFVLAPKSDKSLKKIKNSQKIDILKPLVKHVLSKNNIDYIVVPDLKTKNKFNYIFEDDEINQDVITCNQIKDIETGEVKGFKFNKNVALTNKNVLILDSFCLKGGNLYNLGIKLQESGVKNVYLILNYLDSSIKYSYIYEDENDKILLHGSPIDEIYCFDTILSETESVWLQDKTNLTVYDTKKFINLNEIQQVKEY